MAEVQVKNLNQGGIADSDYIGAQGSVAEAVNLDIHSESGIIKCNQALTKDSGTTVTGFVTATVPCSNGSTYLFDDAGKVYERESDGSYTEHATVAPAAGAVGVLSAYEYQGYVYYATELRLGRFAIPTAGVAPTLSSNFGTFGVGDALHHPMHEVNLVLYIGDGNQVAQVDAGTFSANALDIQEPLRISSLWNLDTDLLIGTFTASNVVRSQIIRWNTWSVSFSISDPIPEVGINAFIDSDNTVIVNCGTKGNLYIYDGAQLSLYKKIKGDFTSDNKAKVLNNARFNFNGMPLFGLSQEAGTGVNLGVYSIARTNRNYPYVLNLEFTISTGNLNNIKIGSIVPISADQFLVSWQDDNSSTTYGVDILNLTTKATGHLVTRVMYVNRQMASTWGIAHAPYRSLPASTAIRFYNDVDHAGLGSEIASTDDEDRNTVRTNEGLGDAHTLKTKVELVPNANDAPEVEAVIFDLPND